MIATGLVDTGDVISVGGVSVAAACGESHRYLHIPSVLDVPDAPDSAGRPDLTVELVRGGSPGRPPEPYAVLDLRLTLRAPPTAARAAVAAADPAARISLAPIQRGYLRFEVVDPSADGSLAAALAEPVEIASNGLDAGRLVRRLTPDGGLLLLRLLDEGAAAIAAHAELVIAAVAARSTSSISFDGGELERALRATAADGLITWTRAAALWSSDAITSASLPGEQRAAVAGILADWTLAHRAIAAASTALPPTPTYALRTDATLTGPITWDLSEYRSIEHVALADVDLAGAARRAAALGAGALRRESTVPALETGMITIAVDANLPARIAGVDRVGVSLAAPPAPPARVDPLAAAVLFESGHAPPPVHWRLSPTEPLRYAATAFVLRGTASPPRLDGPARSRTQPDVLIGVADLPVELITVAAGDQLLAQADVKVQAGSVTVNVDKADPEVAIVVDGAAEMTVTATPIGGGAGITSLIRAPRSTRLDVLDFPAYGPQQVSVSVDFDTPASLVVVELAPGDGSRLSQTVALTPARPTATWSYRNDSIFGGSYRYRAGLTTPDGPWTSADLGSPLQLRASGLAGSGGGPFVADGLIWLPTADPVAWQFCALSPGLAHDPAGQPLATVLPSSDGGGFFQLEARLYADDAAVEAGRTQIAARAGVDRALVQARPAPLAVSGATLLLGGAEAAQSATSGLPPYAAVFHVQCVPAQFVHAVAAAAGQSGHASVRYDVGPLPAGFAAFADQITLSFDVGGAASSARSAPSHPPEEHQ